MAKIVGTIVVGLSLVFLGQTREAHAAQLAELVASDPTASANFGLSIAAAGNTLVVGAPAASTGGVVYIFQQSGNTFTQTARIEPTGPNSTQAEFGFSVAYDGTTLVVGAPQRSTATGAAYVFVQNPNWTQQAVLTAADGATFDMFGNAVSVSGSLVAVGASSKPGGGAAYVYAGTGGTWVQQAKLAPSDTPNQFGSSVSLQGTRVAVGASGTGNIGAAYVFAQSGSTWSQQTKLVPSDGAAGDTFGDSLSFQSNMIVVGDSGQNTTTGAAYIFTPSGLSWTQSQKLTAPDGATFDQFGLSVAAAAGRVVVGAHGHSSQRGEAYAFVQSGSTWTLQQNLTASDGGSNNLFGHSVAIIGSNAAASAPLKTSGQGAVYVFSPPAPPSVPALGLKGTLLSLVFLLLAGATALRVRAGAAHKRTRAR